MSKPPMDDPYPGDPKERSQLLSTIRERIDAWPEVPDDFKAFMKTSDYVFLGSHISKSEGNRYYGGQLGHRFWVIKNDDLNLVGQLGSAAVAIVTFFSVPTAQIAVMAVGLALSMIGIAHKFSAKTVVIEEEDYHVLMALKQGGPSTISEIAAALSGLHIYGSNLWDETRTVAALNKLK